MTTYRECIKTAQKAMRDANLSEQSAMLLMLELANMQAHDLYMEYETDMPADLYEAYQQGFKRLITGEPLQHILGYEWFYGYKFKVNEDVLIPRPETEELVANILAGYDEYFSDKEDVVCCDIGTGSGAIAITLKKEEPKLNVIASDISEKAIDVAIENEKANNITAVFCVGDMVEPLIERKLKVDIFVSNPPYIPNEEELEHSVKDFEPHVALFGGNDGLKFYRILFERAKLILNEKSMMAFEIGYNQKEALMALAGEYYPEARIEVLKDMNGKNRMLFIYNNCD